MKKYLFLIILFLIYILLSINNKSINVISYDDSNLNLSKINIDFKTGINSNKLKKIFSKYNYEYIINNISINDNDIKLDCNNYSKCLDEIYKQQDELFSENYIYNGFKINKILITAYRSEILPFLNKYKLNYILK